jgi:hypothetical protein
VGFINVYLNGVLLGSADYTATNGTTVVLATGAAAGNLVTVESFQISSVANAIPNAAGAVSSSNIVDGSVTPAKLSTGGLYWDTSSNVGIGTTSPGSYANQTTLAINGTTYGRLDLMNGGTVRGYLYGGSAGITLETGGALPVAFATNGTERMRINSSGYVTTPYQPAFRVRFNGSASFSAGTTIVFPTVDYNTGSCYSTGTGRFTAPVAGKYLFYAQLLGENSANRGYFFISKNGDSSTEASGTVEFYNSVNALAILDLAAGDYVMCYPQTTNWYLSPSNQDFFTGFLIG